MIFLGFSVQAEHAHQNQRRLPLDECWVKEHLPITNTAGAAPVLKSQLPLRSNFIREKSQNILYICPLSIPTKNNVNGHKTTCYKLPAFCFFTPHPLTAASSICIKFTDLLEISFNKSEWPFFNLIFSFAILSAAKIKVASLLTDDLLEYWVSILVTSLTR